MSTERGRFLGGVFFVGVVALIFPPPQFLAATESAAASAAHADPVAPILLALMLIALGAALGGRWMSRLGQAAVLGELLVGVLVANLGFYFGQPTLTILREGETIRNITAIAFQQSVTLAQAAHLALPPGPHADSLAAILATPAGLNAVSVYGFVDPLARIAVIVLLFLVGLETSVSEMRQVGKASFFVAVTGVVAPFLLGLGAMAWLTPQSSLARDLFIGGILTATSVGITARVLRDLHQAQRTEAKIILGAAVIDDVLGLLVLAVVSALVVAGRVSVTDIAVIALKALLFLAGSIWIGLRVTPHLVKRLARLEMKNFRLLFGLGFAFALSWLANWAGLAPIVGAFAAGLVLGEFFLSEMEGKHSLRELLSPLESLIVPVFFVLMGMQVKLEAFAELRVIGIAAALTGVAIAGKVVAGLACSRKVSRLGVGIGMMPRGEVGLIFAGIGKGLGVVDDAIFSAAVIMVMITTLLTPPLLKAALKPQPSPAE